MVYHALLYIWTTTCINCSRFVFFLFSIVKEYHTYAELNNGLDKKEVEAALIDLYVVSNHKELSSNPNLRVFKIFDYKKTFGVVLAGPAMKQEKCFLEFVRLNQGDISHKIEQTVKTASVC